MNKMITPMLFALPMMQITSCTSPVSERQADKRPNIVIIYTDDVGYGDIGSYGATRVNTPEIDHLAANGLRFTHAYATTATCTPSRYSLLTGEYAWRKPGTNILRGDAALIIDPEQPTIASVLKQAGYSTAVVGKWHLGLGPEGGPDWNTEIRPGPGDLGFDYSFLIPATGDRVPCVYVENHYVVNHDPDDPIFVRFDAPFPGEPTGSDNPELLKMHPSMRHDNSIVNGISRIGHMTGGKTALWRDEDMADDITIKALEFMEKNKDKPFFLFFATHDIHVPRVPHERFAGLNEMGPRGDVILQLDWCVGEIMKKLDELNLTKNTLVIFSSDNGPVIDDGYHDDSVEKLGDHKPAGPFRGAKYSAYEGGTRVPFIVHWPDKVKPGVSEAPFSQVDLLASLASLAEVADPENIVPDSYNHLPALIGLDSVGRQHIIEQNAQGTLSIIMDGWKYIEPSDRQTINIFTRPHIELGNNPFVQLFNLDEDIGEQHSLADQFPEKVAELAEMLQRIRDQD